MGLPVRANAGVRYFSTELTSQGMLNTGTTLEPVAIVHHYNDFLPAANIAVDVSQDMVARFSINRNISRPALSDLAAAGTLTTRPTGGSISAGNPNLRPFMADSIEASLDYYEGRTGYASIGVFYKNMESFITTTTKQVPYNTTGYPLSFLLQGEDPSTLFDYSAPINGKGAVIAGLEAAVQKDFDFLPAPFDHLGVQGNVTYADGNTGVIYSGTSIKLPLMNLSKLATNVTLYYETDKWGIRVSDAYRSRYLDGAGGGGNIGDAYSPTNNVDLAAHYNVDDHLKVVVEGINLTNQPIKQYEDVTAKRPEVDTTSGETFTFGITYDF
ncbi:MAG: TonB-dependent receptor [Rhizomicrobium sp.]